MIGVIVMVVAVGVSAGAPQPQERAAQHGRADQRDGAVAGDDLRGALNDLSWKLNAQDDIHVSATYRRHLVRQLGWRVIEEAK